MSQKKIGRPTDNPKNISVRIRMDKTTVKKLDKCCEVEKLNRSEMIRKSIHKFYDGLQDK
ncbi:ribbon-helix-helix domain-containing protein [Maledivibacter halophilus]|uniref:Ribbon-helix-helix protein, copG family n=1 Tax=Maledivibacter halophilus TaxID=36842 RepID=A0A1T5KQB4_9FIRM|nr:ribbon-helix-helix domain-containing protein [Maledivibacter halophilus]SKC65831.1 Ribbon-helix-helix protein, copG family [Maledivibacter halophilus]